MPSARPCRRRRRRRARCRPASPRRAAVRISSCVMRRWLPRGSWPSRCAERPGLLDDDRPELGDARGDSRSVGPETQSAASRAPGAEAPARRPRRARARARRRRSRSRRGGRVASSAANSAGSVIVREVSASSGPASAPAAPKATSTLPFAVQWYGTRRPTQWLGAEVVARVDLGEVLDAVDAGDGDVDRLAAWPRRAPPSGARRARPAGARRSRGRRSAPSPGPARKAPRRPSCSTSPLRSSAPSRRDAVLLGSPASAASSPSGRGALGLEHERQQLRAAIDRSASPA